MGKAPDLATLGARAAIADVINSYCHIIDRRRWADMHICHHQGATYQFGAIKGSWPEFVAAAKTVIDPLLMSQHILGNMLIHIDGDRADTETYFTAYHRVAADAPADAVFPGTGVPREIVIAGRYVDRFECRDGDWRIAHRTGLSDWRRDTPASESGLYDQPAEWRGRFGRDDPGSAVLTGL
jgi:hypothetical protein